MSETARTAETRDALRRLAERFARLAESRMSDRAGQCAKTALWTLLRPTDTHSSNP
jgi:hypothetical protein